MVRGNCGHLWFSTTAQWGAAGGTAHTVSGVRSKVLERGCSTELRTAPDTFPVWWKRPWTLALSRNSTSLWVCAQDSYSVAWHQFLDAMIAAKTSWRGRDHGQGMVAVRAASVPGLMPCDTPGSQCSHSKYRQLYVGCCSCQCLRKAGLTSHQSRCCEFSWVKTLSLGILCVLGCCRWLVFKAEAILEIHVAGSTSVCRQTHPSHTCFMLRALFSPPLVWSFCFTVCFSGVCWMLSLLMFDLGKGEFMGTDKRLMSFSAGAVTALVWILFVLIEFWLRPNDLRA